MVDIKMNNINVYIFSMLGHLFKQELYLSILSMIHGWLTMQCKLNV